MATLTEIKSYRIKIHDPVGANEIIEVASIAALPAAPKKGACYYAQDTGYYWKTDLLSGAVAANYYQPDTRLSDTRISDWIDLYGVLGALVPGIKSIMLSLLDEMKVKRNTAGIDSTEFTDLKQLYDAYKDILKDLEEEAADDGGISTGSMIQTKKPEIAGGQI